jgi:hypothetical protein
MAFNYSPKIVTNGLVLYLDAANQYSYVSGSTSWRDISRGGNNGTLVNGPTYNSVNGGSIVFDGSDDYINCGTSFNNLTTQLSINLWGKINGSPTDGVIVTKGENDGAITSNFGFQISPSSCLRFYAKVSGASYTTIDSNTNIRDNNINNYALTYNAGTVIFYKNGNLYSSHTFGLSSLPTTTGPLYMATLKGYATGYFPGNIYSTQIYNRALSATEVLQNYNATKTRFGL